MNSLPVAALVLAFVTATIATVSNAHGDDRSTAASTSGASGAAFSALPSGVIAPPPKAKPPASIAANEKVAGFFMAGRKGRGDYLTIAPTAKIAKQLNDGSRDDSALAGEACFTEDRPGSSLRRSLGGDEPEPRAWRNDLQPMLTMNTSVQQGQRPPVAAVHSERIAEDGAKVTLEVVDAWVDPSTRGARLIARSSVPLALVSTLLGGTKVYAAREGQSVHVILVTPKVARSSGQGGLFAIADNNVTSSACDHIRATIKTEKGQGQTASFISNVELPSLEPKEPKEPKDTGGLPGPAPPRQEARIRPIHVHASVTWPSREKEALLSVSAGWDSRERIGFVF